VGVGAGSTGVTGGLTEATAGASCFKYWAATKANASAGGSISSQSPLALSSFTVSPRLRVPSTLKFSPGPPRTFNFFGRTVLLEASKKDELTQTWIEGGRVIFAQAEGSSGPEFLRMISSKTVTGSLFVTRPSTSPLSPALPRTFTLLAMTTPEPGINGTVFNSIPALFLAVVGAFAVFFFAAFFFSAFAAGVFVSEGEADDAFVIAGEVAGVVIGGAG